MLENTWLIVASDHGDYTGEKGLFNQSECLYECLLHVPLIIVPPAGTRAARWSLERDQALDVQRQFVEGLYLLAEFSERILHYQVVKTGQAYVIPIVADAA